MVCELCYKVDIKEKKCSTCAAMYGRYIRVWRFIHNSKPSIRNFAIHMMCVSANALQSCHSQKPVVKPKFVTINDLKIKPWCSSKVTKKLAQLRRRHTVDLKQSADTLVNVDELCDLLNKSGIGICTYCGKKEKLGLDRSNNLIGYTFHNSVPCCRICNYIKADLNVFEFISHVSNIVKALETKRFHGGEYQ